MTVVKNTRNANLLNKIRNHSTRQITINNPRFAHVNGTKTVLAMEHKNELIGILHTKSRREARKAQMCNKVHLRIGWDKNRNERIVAEFE